MSIPHFVPRTDNNESGGGNYYNTALSKMDPAFMDRIINSYNSRKTSTTEAADL